MLALSSQLIVATLELGILHIIFGLSRLKDNETVRQLRQLRWLRTRVQTATAPTAETTADTLPRNGLMVLMVLIVLKKMSCPPGFQTEPKFLANDTTKNENREAAKASLFSTLRCPIFERVYKGFRENLGIERYIS